MPSLAMVYEIFARDNASPAFRRAGTEAEVAGRKISGMVKALTGFAAADLAYHAVKMAGDFQQATNVLVTAAGESQKNLQKVRDGILAIATATGTSWKQVTDATYTAEKANYRGADALKIVKAAAQGAREENANLATVTNAVTSVMASYHLKASDAVSVTNQIKTAAGESKTTMEEFAGSLSTVLPFASAAHISFADVAGVLGTLTQHGTTANEATQEISNTIRNLTGPLGTARKEMAQFGIDSVDVQKNLGSDKRGLTGTIDYLSQTILKRLGPAGVTLLNTFNVSKQAGAAAQTELEHLGPAAQKLAQGFEDGTVSLADYRKQARALPGEQGALALQFLATYTNAKGFQDVIKQGGPAAQTYAQALKVMLGGTNGLNTALQITGESLAGTQERSKRVADAARGAGKDVSGWASTQKLFNVQFDQFKQAVQAVGIRIGTFLLPPLESLFRTLSKHPVILKVVAGAVLGLVAAWATLKIGNLISGLTTLAAKILGVGTASATASAEAGLGGLARGATGAATGVTGLGTAFASSGLILGGAAVLGIGALAVDLHQIFSDSVKGLPALNAVTAAIAKGGLGGKPGQSVLAQALSGVGTGNSRNEDQLSYLKRILSTTDASKMGLSLKGLFSTIQTGTTGEMKQFLDQLRVLEFQLKGSPDTIDKNLRYLDALFSRYNSGRVDLDRYKNKQLEVAQAFDTTSTNAKKLAKQYGISQPQAVGLAAANKTWADQLKDLSNYLRIGEKTLDQNTKAGRSQADTIHYAIGQAKEHAQAVLGQTWNLRLANKAFVDGVKAIEDNAVKLGYNKQQVDTLVASLLGVKANDIINIEVTANGTFNLKDLALSGVASPTFTPSLAQSPSAYGIPGSAGGGPIVGRGRKGVDSLLRMLAPGEHVVTADEVDAAGGHGAIYAWRKALKRVRGMAGGGAVTLGQFDTQLVPNVNTHLHTLETAMNSVAQKWFKGRQSADLPSFTASSAGADTSGGSAAAKAYAMARLAAMGMASQFPALLRLWTMESSWNPNAVNPTSGAYGIPQALGHGHPYNLGDYQAQVDWGLSYITGRYGSPAAALAHEFANNWYDSGGVLKPGVTQAVNASGKPEAVLTNAQWRYIAAIATGEKNQADVSKFLKAIAAATMKTADKLTSFAQAQSQYRDSLQGQLTTGNTFADIIGQSGNAKDLKTLLGGKLADLKAFALKVVRLKKAGWSDAIIRDISESGVGLGSQYADLLLSASGSDKATINRLSAGLTGGQLSTANLITQSTGGTAGLTSASALAALNKAIYSKGANVPYWVNQAAQKQTLMSVEHQHIHNGADIETALKQAAFAQIAGSFT